MTYEKQEYRLRNISSENSSQVVAEFPDENGKPQLIVYYKTPLGKKYAAYFTLKQDLEFSLNSINYYLNIEDNDVNAVIRQSLWMSAIVTYARCFNDSSKGRKTSLDIKNCLTEDAKEKHLRTHTDIITIRNDYIAHAGNSNHESWDFLVLLSDDRSNKKINSATVAVKRVNDRGQNFMIKFSELITLVNLYVEEKISKIFTRLKEEAHSVPIDDFYSMFESDQLTAKEYYGKNFTPSE